MKQNFKNFQGKGLVVAKDNNKNVISEGKLSSSGKELFGQ